MGLFGFMKECAGAIAEGCKEGWTGQASEPKPKEGDWSLEDALNFEPYHNEHINYPIASMHEHKEYERICAMDMTQLYEEFKDQQLEDSIRPEEKGTSMWWVRIRTMLVMQRQRQKEGQRITKTSGNQPGLLDFFEAAGEGIIKGQLLSDAINHKGVFKR